MLMVKASRLMKFLLLFGLTFIQYITLVAQNDKDVSYYEQGFDVIMINARSTGIKGTPFLFDHALYGNITLKSGKQHERISFNIDLLKEELIIQGEGSNGQPLPVRNWITLETLGEIKREFGIEMIHAKSKIVEFIGEWEGSRIVALHSKKLVKPTATRDSYSPMQFDTYMHAVSYYKIAGMTQEEIKVNQFVKEIGGNEAKNLIKANKWKIEDPVDFKNLLQALQAK